MFRFLIWFIIPLCVSCSMLTGFLTGMGGGPSVNAELVVGDKEQVVGSNVEVKAESVEKVIGNSDNSTAVASAKEVQINNNAFPMWAMGLLIVLAGLVGWLAPRPHVWKRLIRKT